MVNADPASNLDEMLGVPLSNQPVEVPGVPCLDVLNIDPEAGGAGLDNGAVEESEELSWTEGAAAAEL